MKLLNPLHNLYKHVGRIQQMLRWLSKLLTTIILEPIGQKNNLDICRIQIRNTGFYHTWSFLETWSFYETWSFLETWSFYVTWSFFETRSFYETQSFYETWSFYEAWSFFYKE